MAAVPTTGDYDAYAEEYAASVARREQSGGVKGDDLGILPRLLDLLVMALNNPYGAVIRKLVADYFDSDAISPYGGLWAAGIKTFHHHRTLEQYLDAFLSAGLHLTKLADLPLPALVSVHGPDTILPEG